jgi:hypothetical protein
VILSGGLILALVLMLAEERPAPGYPDAVAAVDHIVYATPDLNLGIQKIEDLLGVRAAPGGQHPGRGTRNALAGLGPGRYLEIIGPDPDQPTPPAARTFGIDDLKEPRLVAWAAKATELERQASDATRQGVALGDVSSGSRKRPDGLLLSWRFTPPQAAMAVAGGVVPFFIDWGKSPHPSESAPAGITLVALRAEHPDPERAKRILMKLGIPLSVVPGPKPALFATVDSPRGRVEIR